MTVTAASAHRRLRRAVAVVATVITCSLLAGCTEEPVGHINPDEGKPIIVMVDRDQTSQVALGNLYSQALSRKGYSSALRTKVPPTFDTRIAWITTGEADVIIGCTGELLAQLNPVTARELSAAYVADRDAGRIEKNSWDWQERVFAEMAKALPDLVTATEPSNAQACEQSGQLPLPQNVVPIVRKTRADKAVRTTLNNVTGTIITTDVKNLTSVLVRTGVITGAATDFLLEHGM
ncbi:MAG: hypothetical protein SPI77_03210 [Corynebacterium sp.]|nr:hypothetical protein [Corynebacterium sp.]